MQTNIDQEKSRWDEIKEIWQESAWLWIVPGMILGIAIGFLISLAISADLDNWFIDGIWPEVLGTSVAVALIYQLDRWRDDRREKNRLKKELIWQATSRSRDVAVSALDRIRLEGWLQGEDSVLKGIDFGHLDPKWDEAELTKANLQGAKLRAAKMQQSKLQGANFESADLTWANFYRANMGDIILRGAYMSSTKLQNTLLWYSDMRGCDCSLSDLQEANLAGAKMQWSDLRGSNFQNAYMFLVNLFGSHLGGANLTGAYLLGADIEDVVWVDKLFGPAILPDGTVYEKDEDLQRFVDPDAPDLWVPDAVLAPIGEAGLEGSRETARNARAMRDAASNLEWLPPRMKEHLPDKTKKMIDEYLKQRDKQK